MTRTTLLVTLTMVLGECGGDEPPAPAPTSVEIEIENLNELENENRSAGRAGGRVPAEPARPQDGRQDGAHNENETELPAGPAFTPDGDVVLRSSRGVRWVVTALDHKGTFQESGGNLADIVVGDGADVFDGMATWLEREFPRQGKYTDLAVAEDGASVTVSGADSGDPLVAVATTWTVLPEGDDARVLGRLGITTVVTSGREDALPDYDLGDIVGWGGLDHYAPTRGTDLAGVRDAKLPWVGGQATDHAVILLSTNALTGPHGSSWSDPVWAAPTLGPGATVVYERQLLVGRTLADLAPAALAHQGTRAGELTVEVHDPHGPAAGVGVELFTLPGAKPALRGVTDADGRLVTSVPAGKYEIFASSPARRSAGPAVAEVTLDAPAVARAEVTAAGGIHVVAQDAAGDAVPARFAFTGRNGTPDPVLGPISFAIGGNRAHLLGASELELPPGDYTVTATRGPGWSTASQDVTVPAIGGGVEAPSLTFALADLGIVPDGWLTCDLHQHAAYSADSAVPPVDGLVASVAEGLDCVATTDHDAVADWTDHFAAAGLSDEVLWLPGIETTSEVVGHFNAYPWDPAHGVVDHAGLTAAEVVAALRAHPEAIVQLNHPAWANGMWARLGFDAEALAFPPDAGETFDWEAIEVLNGKNVAEADEILATWLRMVDAGKSDAAVVGSSDSHRLVGQERGSARTYVDLGGAPATAEAFTAAVRAGRTTASNGPLLTLTTAPLDGDGPARTAVTVTLQAADWIDVDTIELVGGDPAYDGAAWPLGTYFPGDAGFTEEVAGGRRTWTLTTSIPTASADGWLVAVARGDAPMAPWLESPAWAVTSPVRLDAMPTPDGP